MPNQIPNSSPGMHGWNDSENWNDGNWNSPEIDDVEFSLAQICAPLQSIDASNINELTNISQYYNLFINQLSCEEKAKVSKVFRQNRILWDISEYFNEVSVNGLSSDMLRTDKNKFEDGCFHLFTLLNGWLNIEVLNQTWTDTYQVSLLNENSVNEYHISACQGMSFAITDHYWIGTNKTPWIRETNVYLNDQNSSCNNLATGVFYTCGGVDIIIRNGKIELGATDGSKTAELEINAGSKIEIESGLGKIVVNSGSILRIKNGGTLIINDDGILEINGVGKVIIEEGGQIVYNEGSLIELNDPNSIMEIAGNLYIGTNAQFAFTGNGYVKICNSGPDATYNITAGTGASVLFSGSGQTDKVLEVQQNTVHFPQLSSLTFENCKIEMGSSKRMQTDAPYPVTFNNAKVTSTTGVHNNHRGFLLIGQSGVTINNSVFEYGQYGIYANLAWTDGAPLYITNSTFRNNTYGMRILNKGLHLNNCTILDNTSYGIYCSGMSFPSEIFNCTITDNSYGVYYLGSASADIDVEDSNFLNNENNAMQLNGGFDADLNCCEIHNNSCGIYTQNGSRVTPMACDISNNLITINLNYGIVNLQNKYNQLQSLIAGYDVYGYIPIAATCGISPLYLCTHNRWGINTFETPVFNTNYKLWVRNCTPVTPVTLVDNSPMYLDCSFDFQSLESQNNTQLADDTENVMGNFSSPQSESDYVLTIAEIANVINESSQDAFCIYNTAENSYYSKIHKMVYEMLQFVNFNDQNSNFVEAIDILIGLNESLINRNSEFTDQSFEICIDNALLYRMKMDYDSSIRLLDSLLLVAQDQYSLDHATHINHWLCMINAEKAAFQGLLSLDEFLIAIEDCDLCISTKSTKSTDHNYDEEALENIVDNTVDKLTFGINISPNPNNGSFTITFESNCENCEIRVVNSIGQILKQVNPNNLGVNEIFIDGLKTGHYKVICIIDGKIIDSQTVVVE